jgi:uncharacterized protein YecT (DUF1311 family)
MRIFSITLLFILLLPAPVLAQGHNTYCNMADSTAATQSCLKKHLDAAQQRLNKTYNKLETQLETEEKKQELKSLQQTWLDYRDAECAWEAESTETASLKRINELSCMARVTDDRADLLTVIATDDELEGGAREYGSFPRWMNVLAKDYPLVYWDYGKRFTEDLNCDDEAEQMMTGIVVEQQEDGLKEEIVVAVTQNPATGRPKPVLFDFNVGEQMDEETLCSGQITLQVSEVKELPKENEETEEYCPVYLAVKHGTCAPRKIKWTGKNFELEPLPVSDEQIQEEKNK